MVTLDYSRLTSVIWGVCKAFQVHAVGVAFRGHHVCSASKADWSALFESPVLASSAEQRPVGSHLP